jgi:hypothetical protein
MVCICSGAFCLRDNAASSCYWGPSLWFCVVIDY